MLGIRTALPSPHQHASRQSYGNSGQFPDENLSAMWGKVLILSKSTVKCLRGKGPSVCYSLSNGSEQIYELINI